MRPRLLVLVGLLVVGIGTVPLVAHLRVVKTMPANGATMARAPQAVQVWFSQAPSARVSRLDLSGPDGDMALGDLRIENRDRSIAADVRTPLPPGRYEVAWRTAGTDGHVQRGTFTFTVTPAE